ncbi:hypothetical protein IEQ34_007865 [Dendrobium chrysotoxum]|uniref:Uncharacterized protein n=1 Tax=Dendrobium chrysotoxum TaxID=161865 RepID=A0AAV7H6R9_DENCH|nr:hypothetical protein IEQ34_007865 [Dendrobium chrysotoxum]
MAIPSNIEEPLNETLNAEFQNNIDEDQVKYMDGDDDENEFVKDATNIILSSEYPILSYVVGWNICSSGEIKRLVSGCQNITSPLADEIARLAAQRWLKSLQSLPSSLESLSSLQNLSIYEVPKFWELPILPPSLKFLAIKKCHPELHERYQLVKGSVWYKIAHIPNVDISTDLDQLFQLIFNVSKGIKKNRSKLLYSYANLSPGTFLLTLYFFCNCKPETVSQLFFECDFYFSILKVLFPGAAIFLLRLNII